MEEQREVKQKNKRKREWKEKKGMGEEREGRQRSTRGVTRAAICVGSYCFPEGVCGRNHWTPLQMAKFWFIV